ncbi:MAG TPA: transcriptional regulator, partial [Treponema sp.]|nr:transcriptional regulator [Treponema sp.]
MSTTKEYIDFVCEQIELYGEVRNRKMFGEYMAYLNEK